MVSQVQHTTAGQRKHVTIGTSQTITGSKLFQLSPTFYNGAIFNDKSGASTTQVYGVPYTGTPVNQLILPRAVGVEDTLATRSDVRQIRLAYIPNAGYTIIQGQKQFSEIPLFDKGIQMYPITNAPASSSYGYFGLGPTGRAWRFRPTTGSYFGFDLVSDNTLDNYSYTMPDKPGRLALKADIPYSAQVTASGGSTTIVIPHGVSGVSATSRVFVTARNSISGGWSYVDIDNTNLVIYYPVATTSGTLKYDIQIIP
jgi:hypothetical protein